MAGLNKVILIGHLGKDPEYNTTQSGKEVVNFSLATSESWKDAQGQKQQETEWHKITVWGKQAQHINTYLKKGSNVCVEGKIKTRKWQDSAGNDRYTTEIIASNVLFLDSKPKNNDWG